MQEALAFSTGFIVASFICRAVQCQSWRSAICPIGWQQLFTTERRQTLLLYPIAGIILGVWFIGCWQLQLALQYHCLGIVSLYLVLWDWLRLQVPIDGLVLLSALSAFEFYDNGATHPWLIPLLPLGFIALTVGLYKIKRLPIEIPWGDVWALACLSVWLSNISEFFILVGVASIIMFFVRQPSPQIPFIPALCIATAVDILIRHNYFL